MWKGCDMSKLLKIVAGLVALTGLVLVGLIILVKVLVTPERVKALVLPKIEQALQRQVSLGEVRVGLFSGIELHDLKVVERSGELLASVDQFKLRFQLLPLLARQVVVDEIRLVRPQLMLVRQADGTLTIADLLSAPAKPESGQPQVTEQDGEGGGISLLVSQAKVTSGKITFIDRQVAPTVPVRIELNELDMELRDFSLQGKVPIKLRGLVNGAPLALDGQLQLADKAGTLSIDLQGFDVTSLAPYYRERLPGQLSAARIDLKVNFDGNARVFTLRGQMGLRDLAFKLLLPQASLDKGALASDVELTADLDKGTLSIAKGEFDLNGIKLAATGAVRGLSFRPDADLQVTIPALDLRTVLAAMPKGLLGKAADLEPSGTLRGSLALKGPLDGGRKLLQSADLKLEQVQVSVSGQRPAFSGRLLLSGDRLTSEGLQMRLGDDSAQLDVTARNLFGKPLQVAADVSARRLLIEPLLAGAAAKPAAGAQAGSDAARAVGAKPGTGGEIGPFDLPVQAAGTIRIGETVWKGLSVKDFVAEYDLRDNQLKIARMTGNFAGGTFANTARVDLRQPGLSYDATISLEGVEAQSLLPALAPQAAGTLFGRLDLQGSVRGSGTRWETLSRSLTGDAALTLADGRLVSPALVKGFATFLQLSDLNDIVFKEFRGKSRIVNGQAEIDSLLAGSRLKLFPRGTLGLDGTLRLALDTRLAPELAARLDRRGKVTGYLTDADGWTQIPLLLEGSLQAPRFGLDPKGVQAQAGKVIQQELQRGIDKLLTKQKTSTKSDQAADNASPAAGQPESPPAEQPTSPANKLLDDSLRRLFKR
jgi:AsmA protein